MKNENNKIKILLELEKDGSNLKDSPDAQNDPALVQIAGMNNHKVWAVLSPENKQKMRPIFQSIWVEKIKTDILCFWDFPQDLMSQEIALLVIKKNPIMLRSFCEDYKKFITFDLVLAGLQSNAELAINNMNWDLCKSEIEDGLKRCKPQDLPTYSIEDKKLLEVITYLWVYQKTEKCPLWFKSNENVQNCFSEKAVYDSTGSTPLEILKDVKIDAKEISHLVQCEVKAGDKIVLGFEKNKNFCFLPNDILRKINLTQEQCVKIVFQFICDKKNVYASKEKINYNDLLEVIKENTKYLKEGEVDGENILKEMKTFFESDFFAQKITEFSASEILEMELKTNSVKEILDENIKAFPIVLRSDIDNGIKKSLFASSLDRFHDENPKECRKLVLEMLAKDGLWLQHVKKQDLYIVYKAVSQNPLALEYVDKKFKAKEIEWMAIEAKSEAVKYCENIVLEDEDKKLIFKALGNGWLKGFELASEQLKKNDAFLSSAAQLNPVILTLLPKGHKARQDGNIMGIVCQKNMRNLKYFDFVVEKEIKKTKSRGLFSQPYNYIEKQKVVYSSYELLEGSRPVFELLQYVPESLKKKVSFATAAVVAYDEYVFKYFSADLYPDMLLAIFNYGQKDVNNFFALAEKLQVEKYSEDTCTVKFEDISVTLTTKQFQEILSLISKKVPDDDVKKLHKTVQAALSNLNTDNLKETSTLRPNQ